MPITRVIADNDLLAINKRTVLLMYFIRAPCSVFFFLSLLLHHGNYYIFIRNDAKQTLNPAKSVTYNLHPNIPPPLVHHD